MLATVRGWLLENMENMDAEGTVFIAEDEDGATVGAATVERSAHFTAHLRRSWVSWR